MALLFLKGNLRFFRISGFVHLARKGMVMSMEQNTLYWLWLTNSRGVSHTEITSLLEQFDTVEEIYKKKDFSLASNIKPSTRKALADKSLKSAEAILEVCNKKGITILTYDDINFPDILRGIYDPPYVLYLRGEIMKWDRILGIGVVGTRACGRYGVEATRRIALDLAENGVTVITGMARGIDTVATRAALDAGGKTVAVLGCGADIVYPPENKGLMEEIIASGAVISEYPPGTKPLRHNFPWRNRIISGLSRGVVVTEAPEKSGALITAGIALGQGRDVFAVPGSIFDKNCAGTNQLLASGAKAVSTAKGILEEYVFEIERLEKPKGIKRFFAPKKEKVNNEIKLSVEDKRFSGLSEEERKIVELLIEKNQHIDDIARKSGIDASKLAGTLSMLEFGGYIQKIPGNNYKLSI